MEIITIVILIWLGVRVEMAIYKKRILPNIVYDCHFNKQEVFEGDSLEIVETVMNPSNLLVPGIKAEITTSNHLEFANEECVLNDKNRSLASVFSVGKKKKITRHWKVKCNRRGIYKIEDTSIVGSDLFGAYKYSTVKRVKSDLIVLPKALDIEEYLQRANDIQGDHIVKRFILQDPFVIAGVREYTFDDPMNRIHWGITASQGKLMVRNNEATAKKSTTILLNIQVSEDQLKEISRDLRVELGIQIAAGQLNKTLNESTPVRLLANGFADEEGHELVSEEMWGKSQVHDLMILLARLNEIYSEHFDHFVMKYKDTIFTTEIIMITCYLDERTIAFIREKEGQGIIVKVYLLTYQTSDTYYEDLNVYYILDYLKEEGKEYAY